MDRFIDLYLKQWVNDIERKPLLLRGARQVGKTFATRKLGQSFEQFVEINCEELEADCQLIFEKDLNPERILRDLSILTSQTIIPGKTLLFFDEIQIVPRTILALRYFYEKMPELHIIAAGSLLEFALEKIGIPVGRVDSFYMFPVTWLEFLLAKGESLLFDAIFTADLNNPISEVAHKKLLGLLGEYFALGGMPAILQSWLTRKDPHACFKLQQTLIDNYRQDFEKYARKNEVKYVEVLFEQVPHQLGKRFKFSSIPGDFRKRDLYPCFNLLIKAGVIHPVYHSNAQGLPLGADVNLDKFKALFLDIGMAQALLGFNAKEWFLDPTHAFVNQGAIAESFVGQEILAYSYAFQKKSIYYWHKETRTSQAEVDYVIQVGDKIIPVEVKSGKTGTLKSLHEYVACHSKTAYALRFSAHNYSLHEYLHSYPLYAVAQALNISWFNNLIREQKIAGA
jgi:predicted AAA+ superfamily ATPase